MTPDTISSVICLQTLIPSARLFQLGSIRVATVCRTVPLTCNNVSGIDFSNYPLLCVEGRKINDCTGEGLAGWQISY